MSVIKVIFWDFDGVLLDSNAIRDTGFERVLEEYPAEQVEHLLAYHRANGGLSRYVKFRYFFENIRIENVSEEQIMHLAQRFSVIMRDLLVNPDLLIRETMDFVKTNYNKYAMHIVSGSDQTELRFLCEALCINQYFKSIHGSPTPKKQLVKELIASNSYAKDSVILIGDSINDYEAALENQIDFAGYNNNSLLGLTTKYIDDLFSK